MEKLLSAKGLIPHFAGLILFVAVCGIEVFHPYGANAQIPNWQWAKSAGGTSYDDGNNIFYSKGYLYLTGNFQSKKIIFGNDTLVNTNTTGNTSDIFIAKYDSLGNAIWAKSAGGKKNDNGLGITADANGNIFVTGYFRSDTIIFGTFILKKYSTYYQDSADVFIVKYDASGNVIWAKSAGGWDCDYGTSIAVDVNGNCYVTGNYQSMSIVFDNDTLHLTGGSNIFLVKYDNSGNVLWAKTTKGDQAERSTSITVDTNGNSYLTGYFWSHVLSFGQDSVLNSCGGRSYMFAVKYDALGNSLWATCAGGQPSTIGNDGGNSIAVTLNGNCCVTGYFASEDISFGSTTLVNHDFNNNTDIFIVEYNSYGNALWAKGYGSANCGDEGTGVTMDANGNAYITGGFGGNVTFGTYNLNSTTGGYLFAVKYDTSGTVLWAKNGGAGAYAYAVSNSITADENGNCYIIGEFFGYSMSNTVSFGSTILTSANINTDDIFIVKLGGNTVSISENNLDNVINVFPNPTRGVFQMQIGNGQSAIGKEYKIEIYNVLGEIVLDLPITLSTNQPINLSSQPDGVYFLQLKTTDGIVTKKVMVMK